MAKSPEAFRTISEVAELLGVPAHVLRFWETRFPQIRPVKRAGGRRYYRPSDVALLGGIRFLLHDQGVAIRGVQKMLREQGVRHVGGLADRELLREAAGEWSTDEAILDELLAPPQRAPIRVIRWKPEGAEASPHATSEHISEAGAVEIRESIDFSEPTPLVAAQIMVSHTNRTPVILAESLPEAVEPAPIPLANPRSTPESGVKIFRLAYRLIDVKPGQIAPERLIPLALALKTLRSQMAGDGAFQKS